MTHRNGSAPRTSPAWTAAGALLLPIAPEAWPPPARGLRLDGIDFAPKSELHATIVGRALGARLRAALAGDAVLAAAIDTACAATDWSWSRGCAWWLLEKRAEGGRKAAIVERIALPGMADFHARLAVLLGGALPVPPPHVTLYTAGDAEGIGVPNEDAWQRCVVRELTATELGGG